MVLFDGLAKIPSVEFGEKSFGERPDSFELRAHGFCNSGRFGHHAQFAYELRGLR